jgi:hypothetical protein
VGIDDFYRAIAHSGNDLKLHKYGIGNAMSPTLFSTAWRLLRRVLPVIIGLTIVAGFMLKMGPLTVLHTIAKVEPLPFAAAACILACAMLIKATDGT